MAWWVKGDSVSSMQVNYFLCTFVRLIQAPREQRYNCKNWKGKADQEKDSSVFSRMETVVLLSATISDAEWLVKCSNDNAALPYSLYVRFSCFKFHFIFPSLYIKRVAKQILLTWTVNSVAKFLERTDCHRILTHIYIYTYTRESYSEVSKPTPGLQSQPLGCSNPEDAKRHRASLPVCSAGTWRAHRSRLSMTQTCRWDVRRRPGATAQTRHRLNFPWA